LPAGDLGFAAGWESYKSLTSLDADDLYASGSVLGLNSFSDTPQQTAASKSLFSEIKAPIISAKNKIPFVESLTLGAIARREKQTNTGFNASTSNTESRTYTKVNPSVNLKYSPTKDYLVRASWSKGFLAPGLGAVFGTAGQNNPTLQDPLGFATNPQTTIVVRPNSSLQSAVSKATSVGLVGTPRNLLKGFTFSIDYYKISVEGIVASNFSAILAANAAGQGSGFIFGNAATINPNAPFANLISRRSNGQLNSAGNLGAGNPRGAVLSDFTNIASRDVQGLEYAASYDFSTQDWGRFKLQASANQFVKFEQTLGPGTKPVSFVGKFVSTVGDPISPGSIPRWKGNIGMNWDYKNFSTNVIVNYIAAYKDDPLFVLSPQLKAFYDAGTGTTANPAFVAYLAAGALVNPRVGGEHTIDAFTTLDWQTTYRFGDRHGAYLKDLDLTIGVTNVFDKLAPLAFGGFNDNIDTRTHNNIGRFVYVQLRKQF
jgi:iron complex outermembrane receptor protein